MNRILIKPVKRWFSKRQQWTFELRGANGEQIDPRDTYNNRMDARDAALAFRGPVELVIYDRFGEVESRELLH
jgi:hypothetical protein